MPMFDELFLYDRDNGLFKQVLNNSSIIQGRYHIAPSAGHELNTANLEQYFKNAATGQSDVPQKYPCMVLLAPKSRAITINAQYWDEYFFNGYFLCKSGRTGNNQIKNPDIHTNNSRYHTWYDWNDMKKEADKFLNMLKEVIKKKTVDGVLLRTEMELDYENYFVTRLSKFNNDELNGVGVSFVVRLYRGNCEMDGYDLNIDDLVISFTMQNDIYWYTADGTEGMLLVLNGENGTKDLSSKYIVSVNRENYELKPVSGSPTNKQFGFNPSIPGLVQFATPLEYNEQIKFTYRDQL